MKWLLEFIVASSMLGMAEERELTIKWVDFEYSFVDPVFYFLDVFLTFLGGVGVVSVRNPHNVPDEYLKLDISVVGLREV